MSSDKRKYLRISKKIIISYQTLYEKSDFSFGKASANNISIGGIQFETEDIDAVGTRLLMKIHIIETKLTIEAKGIVVWVKRLKPDNYQLGVEFTEIKDEDFLALKQLCHHKDY